LLEVAKGDLVLAANPIGGFLGSVVFEPAIRIFHHLIKVGIHLIHFAGVGVPERLGLGWGHSGPKNQTKGCQTALGLKWERAENKDGLGDSDQGCSKKIRHG
jgi:hypothetical protein